MREKRETGSPSHLFHLFIGVNQCSDINPLLIEFTRHQTVRQTTQKILKCTTTTILLLLLLIIIIIIIIILILIIIIIEFVHCKYVK